MFRFFNLETAGKIVGDIIICSLFSVMLSNCSTEQAEELLPMDPPNVIIQSNFARTDIGFVRWITVDGVLCLQFGDNHQGSVVPFPGESGMFETTDEIQKNKED